MSLDLVLGCDTNAHNMVCGCKDTNKRGKVLLEYVASSGLKIANVGSEPTFHRWKHLILLRGELPAVGRDERKGKLVGPRACCVEEET